MAKNKLKEVFIETRKKGKEISLQGPGISRKKDEVIDLLETALNALKGEGHTDYGNETVIKKKNA